MSVRVQRTVELRLGASHAPLLIDRGGWDTGWPTAAAAAAGWWFNASHVRRATRRMGFFFCLRDKEQKSCVCWGNISQGSALGPQPQRCFRLDQQESRRMVCTGRLERTCTS